VAVIWVALTTAKVDAAVPLKRTAVAPVRLVPVNVTLVPTNPDVGLKELRVGAVLAGVLLPPQPTQNIRMVRAISEK